MEPELRCIPTIDQWLIHQYLLTLPVCCFCLESSVVLEQVSMVNNSVVWYERLTNYIFIMHSSCESEFAINKIIHPDYLKDFYLVQKSKYLIVRYFLHKLCQDPLYMTCAVTLLFMNTSMFRVKELFDHLHDLMQKKILKFYEKQWKAWVRFYNFFYFIFYTLLFQYNKQ